MYPGSGEGLVQTLVAIIREDSSYHSSRNINTLLAFAKDKIDSQLVDRTSSISGLEASRGEVQKYRERYQDRRENLESGLTVLKNHWVDNAWHDEIDIQGDFQLLRATVADLHERDSIPASSKVISSEIHETEEEISRCNESLRQCEDGLSRLSSAFQGGRIEEKLDDFVKQHTSIITTLFKAFQRPYDFKSVELRGGKVKVTRRGEQSRVEISKMSSGQRAALALAIFVTNNLAHDSAPPLMMLDEPFAHLDDMNTISFFNLVIELATREERQIIFATANEDIATLLERKVGDSSKFIKETVGEPG